MKLKPLRIKNNDSLPAWLQGAEQMHSGYQGGCPHTLLSCQEASAVPDISLGSVGMKTPKRIVQDLFP